MRLGSLLETHKVGMNKRHADQFFQPTGAGWKGDAGTLDPVPQLYWHC